VGNTPALRETFLVEAFNLKAAIELSLGQASGGAASGASSSAGTAAALESLADMPPRSEEELDPVSLHNSALVVVDSDPTTTFRKLNFLLSHPPFPAEAFGNLLLLYIRHGCSDLAADALAENAHLTLKYLSPALYEFLDASLMAAHSAEEAYRRFDALAVRHIEALRRRTREDLVVDRFLVKRVAERVALSPEEARRWYEEHPERFPKVEQVRCQQIAAATREDLDIIRLDLQHGADFTKLAREKSTSEDKVRAGDLGWFSKGQMLPEFEEACFALKKGQVSSVLPTAYGFHLLRLVDRRDGPRPSYPAVQDAVDLELRRERVAKAQTDFLQKLREQADVQVHDAELDKVP
jgi:parvulin-like peptidyl-prolyl isomerase